ncbi:MAG: TIGR02757 family protein [Marinilabiliaceae bacterium]|nr:TIGR02757 family protein [Marinilabiliaceae bacterium]
MNDSELKELLDAKAYQYESPAFIAADPISIPHRYSRKEDIEISGFLAATIAWGNRKAIVKNAEAMMLLLNDMPYEFVTEATESDLAQLQSFVYRTFQQDDLAGMVRGLRDIYANHGGLENVLTPRNGETVGDAFARFRRLMLPHLSERTYKHIANYESGAACKRLNMYLRWMVRSARGGVDFGLWHGIKPSQLMLPLDVHTAQVGRQFGLLQRKQNDWRAVEEITARLRSFDPNDPIRYDFALFGLGIFDGLGKGIETSK